MLQTPVDDFVGEGFKGSGDAVSVAKLRVSTNLAIRCFAVEDGKGKNLSVGSGADGRWKRDDT